MIRRRSEVRNQEMAMIREVGGAAMVLKGGGKAIAGIASGPTLCAPAASLN